MEKDIGTCNVILTCVIENVIHGFTPNKEQKNWKLQFKHSTAIHEAIYKNLWVHWTLSHRFMVLTNTKSS